MDRTKTARAPLNITGKRGEKMDGSKKSVNASKSATAPPAGRNQRVPGKIEASLYLDREVLIALKHRAVDEGKTYSVLANEILRAELLPRTSLRINGRS